MPEPISYYTLVKIAKRFHETRPKSNVQIHSQINDIILRRKCNMLAILFFIMANSIINIARRIFHSEVVLLKEKYFVQIIGNFIAIPTERVENCKIMGMRTKVNELMLKFVCFS